MKPTTFLLAASLLAATISAAMSQSTGSFLESCQQVTQRGPILEAFCADGTGRFGQSRLDRRSCARGGNIANVEGRLARGPEQPAQAQPSDQLPDQRQAITPPQDGGSSSADVWMMGEGQCGEWEQPPPGFNLEFRLARADGFQSSLAAYVDDDGRQK